MEEKPLIVQSDMTLLLEVEHPKFEEARARISRFAELIKSPEYIHTYRITPLSLWNAASLGIRPEEVIDTLYEYSKFPVPQVVSRNISRFMSRYGKLRLIRDEGGNLVLEARTPEVLKEVLRTRKIEPYIEGKKDDRRLYIWENYRGLVKQALIKVGYPVEDFAGYEEGNYYPFELRKITRSGKPFRIRDYQQMAIDAFYADGRVEGGSGVIVLPCGAGKTIVGIGIMHKLATHTLILVTNTVVIRQWKEELLDKTTIKEEDIGEYYGEKKEIKPITIATYNILTHRKRKGGEFTHFHLFTANNWGLIIYDEVHLLPAPVFRLTAEIQAKRRLGLTATLVREDGLEEDVFSLIGPKKFDMPWKLLEEKSWIAKARCIEVKIPMRPLLKSVYANADDRAKFRIASENPEKIRALKYLLKKHTKDQVLIIGQYLNQLEKIAKRFSLPLITGKTPVEKREELYKKFRRGEIKTLVVSRVANFSIDLPDANVAIQVSGTFGSRQEEAQRLGRILRPKEGENEAIFYTLISADSVEERFSHNRQLFLTEQGYEYEICPYENLKEEDLQKV